MLLLPPDICRLMHIRSHNSLLQLKFFKSTETLTKQEERSLINQLCTVALSQNWQPRVQSSSLDASHEVCASLTSSEESGGEVRIKSQWEYDDETLGNHCKMKQDQSPRHAATLQVSHQTGQTGYLFGKYSRQLLKSAFACTLQLQIHSSLHLRDPQVRPCKTEPLYPLYMDSCAQNSSSVGQWWRTLSEMA